MSKTLAIAFVLTASTLAGAQTHIATRTAITGWNIARAVHATVDQNSDGYHDMVMGAPGANGGQGTIRCVSGNHFTTELWSLTPAMPNAAGFGSSIIEVGSLTGNSATDYLIGAPYYQTGLYPTGALILVDGATKTVAWTMVGHPNTRLGTSIAAVGDQDGDGKVDIVVTAPSTSGSASKVHMIRGAAFGAAGSVAAANSSSFNVNDSPDFGATVASGFDLDQDGRFDVAIGSPDLAVAGGMVHVLRADGTWAFLAAKVGPQTGERFGASIDGRRDFDGDGVVDFVVGAPGWSSGFASGIGRVFVFSGAALLAGTSPSELFTLYHTTGATSALGLSMGACVRSSVDLNGDGVPEVLVGAPGYFNPIPYTPNRGAAMVFSGRTGVRLAFVAGSANERLGDGLLSDGLDMNLDGFPDFGVAGSNSDVPVADCGTFKVYSLFPSPAATFCTGKVNSAGCTPGMFSSGSASATSSSPFTVTCSNLINQVSGLFIYSHRPNAAPFQGGTLCVKAPIRRSGSANTGGSTSGTDCSGVLSLDFNARIQSGVDPTLVAGSEVFTQCWSRDSASASATSLSNAVRFLVNP